MINAGSINFTAICCGLPYPYSHITVIALNGTGEWETKYFEPQPFFFSVKETSSSECFGGFCLKYAAMANSAAVPEALSSVP